MKTPLLGAVAILLGFFFTLYHGGSASTIRIHDNLDGYLPTVAVLAQSDLLFAASDVTFEPLLGGVPRGALPSETQIPVLLYRYLEPSTAFIANALLLRVVALLGMAALLRRHLMRASPPALVCGVALCFSWLPVWEGGSLCIAGQPLLAYAVLNLRERPAPRHSWLLLALFPFFSSLILVGFALVPLVALFFVWTCWRERRLHVPLLLGLLLLAVGYALSEYRLLGQIFETSDFVSHRTEFAIRHQRSLPEALSRAWDAFVHSGEPWIFPAASLHVPFVVLAAGLALLTARPLRSGEARQIGMLIAACVVTSLFVGLYDWTETGRVLDSLPLGALRSAHLGRVSWLSPFLWSLVFALSLASIVRWRFGALAAGALVVAQLGYCFQTQLDIHDYQRVSFEEFFSPALFSEIQNHIGRPLPDYRVVSLGLYPSIPFFNGFYTVDGYASSYPLAHKQAFRKVIGRELAKRPRLANLYDSWGSNCFLYSSEIGGKARFRKILLGQRKPIQNLDIDTRALKGLGADYILSAVRIANHRALGLELRGVFRRDDSPWWIHLYEIGTTTN
ncbi:MAG: DUF6044 family protein [Proteobacteria bacterium]|nr:DUF6044 family protein [Pseudomonadota bacterium]